MAEIAGDVSDSSKVRSQRPLLHPPIYVHASKGNGTLAKSDVIEQHAPRRLHNARDELIRKGKEMYEQKRLKRCRQLEAGSAPNLAHEQALVQKQSVLEIQSILLGKLAAEENYLKGLGGVSKPSILPFDKRVTELEEALRALSY